MPDNIAVTADGRAMMASHEVPWHALGTRIPNDVANSEEMIQAAGLAWTAFPAKSFAEWTDEGGVFHRRELKNKSIIRADTNGILSETALAFTPYQNADMFAWVDAVVGAGGAVYHTAGGLGNGETVWVLVKLPESVFVAGKDQHEKYILITNSHKPGVSLKIILTMVRVVCQNTLNQAVNGAAAGQIVKISHMRNIVERAEEAKKVFGIINQQYDAAEKLFGEMVRIQMTQETLDDFTAFVWPFPPTTAASKGSDARREQAKQNRSLAQNLFQTGVGMDVFPDTLYNAVNAVTELTTHFPGRLSPEAHFNSVMMGERAKAQARAMEFAKRMLVVGY